MRKMVCFITAAIESNSFLVLWHFGQTKSQLFHIAVHHWNVDHVLPCVRSRCGFMKSDEIIQV